MMRRVCSDTLVHYERPGRERVYEAPPPPPPVTTLAGRNKWPIVPPRMVSITPAGRVSQNRHLHRYRPRPHDVPFNVHTDEQPRRRRFNRRVLVVYTPTPAHTDAQSRRRGFIVVGQVRILNTPPAGFQVHHHGARHPSPQALLSLLSFSRQLKHSRFQVGYLHSSQ